MNLLDLDLNVDLSSYFRTTAIYFSHTPFYIDVNIILVILNVMY